MKNTKFYSDEEWLDKEFEDMDKQLNQDFGFDD